MVKITNGTSVFTVTRGAFDGIYSRQGFHLVSDTTKEKASGDVARKETKQDPFAELIEKPISQWSKNEVKDFAAAKEIDISGTKNVNEAKDRIKTFLSEE